MVPGELTSLVWVQVKPDGERCRVIIPMSEKGLLNPSEIDERKECIQSARAVRTELLQNPAAPMVRAAEIVPIDKGMERSELGAISI